MIIDFNNDTTLSFNADICIIGSGAASLAMLIKLYGTRHKVIVVEAGENNITEQNQKLYDVITPYHPFEGARNGRFRVFGGSTTRWGGQSLPLDKIDFMKRVWLPHSGWPISYDTVATYYTDVDKFLNLNDTDYNNDIFTLLNENPLPAISEMQFRFSKWSHIPNLREQYRKEIAKSTNVCLLMNANMTNIRLTENYTTVQDVTIKNLNNKAGKVIASKYILACGGIENARLLLASNLQISQGVGNAHNLVGRFLQDHPRAEVGTLLPGNKKQQSYLNYFYLGKTRFLPRFFFSEDFQNAKQILNTSAYVEFYTKENDVFSIAKEIYRKQIRGDLSVKEFKLALKLIKNLPQLLNIAKHYYINRKVYTPQAMAKLFIMTESSPLWENSVSLSSELDSLGMPRAIVKWKVDQNVYHTLLTCTQLLTDYLNSIGFGEVAIEDWLNTEGWETRIKDSYHHIGTTRMASSKQNGVVDENCQVYDVTNLFIAGSSIFPTSGHSNPTATLIALAFRLIDYILMK